jgi:predicted  nucleic acid-binding Zn-ribbon protein
LIPINFKIRIELVELETALNDIEKSMNKIDSQNSTIQTKLRDLLESNKQMAKEFSDIRRGMTNKFKDVTQQLEQTPGIAHDLAAVTSNTLIKIQQDMI